MKTPLRPLLALLAALPLGCATTSATTAPDAAPAATASAAHVADFELRTVDGETARLSDVAGKKVVVLAFWDTWCEPCRTELPLLDAMYGRHKEKGLELWGVAMDDTTTVANVAPYVKRSGFTFPVPLDVEGRAAALYDKQKVAPYTVVLDRHGRVALEKAGFEPGYEQVLEAKVVELLAQP